MASRNAKFWAKRVREGGMLSSLGRKGVHFELGRLVERLHGTLLVVFPPFSCFYLRPFKCYICERRFFVLWGMECGFGGKRHSTHA
jgi:hypothetical protein